MKLPIFAAVLAATSLTATAALALSWVAIPQTQSHIDFSRTNLQPIAWAVAKRVRYGETVTLTNGEVTLFYSESDSLAFRDSDHVGFGAWFRTLVVEGVSAAALNPAIREEKLRAGPTMYAFISTADDTCIAFRAAVGRITLYNDGFPGHEAVLQGVLCNRGTGGTVEDALRLDAGGILVKY